MRMRSSFENSVPSSECWCDDMLLGSSYAKNVSNKKYSWSWTTTECSIVDVVWCEFNFIIIKISDKISWLLRFCWKWKTILNFANFPAPGAKGRVYRPWFSLDNSHGGSPDICTACEVGLARPGCFTYSHNQVRNQSKLNYKWDEVLLFCTFSF